MALNSSSSLLCLLLLFVSSIFLAAEARPLFINGLSLQAVKNSGPSPGGGGHRFANAENMGGIKVSGPSHGDGNMVVNSGGIEVSSPSPGDGHKFTNGHTLGGIKDSGPSPGGDGHRRFDNIGGLGGHHVMDKNVGGIKLGGGGVKYFTRMEVLGGIKDSGPSPGDNNKIVT